MHKYTLSDLMNMPDSELKKFHFYAWNTYSNIFLFLMPLPVILYLFIESLWAIAMYVVVIPFVQITRKYTVNYLMHEFVEPRILKMIDDDIITGSELRYKFIAVRLIDSFLTGNIKQH